jgi:hypothetical protein
MAEMDQCCDNLFLGFVFEDLRNAHPPESQYLGSGLAIKHFQ